MADHSKLLGSASEAIGNTPLIALDLKEQNPEISCYVIEPEGAAMRSPSLAYSEFSVSKLSLNTISVKSTMVMLVLSGIPLT